MTDLTDEAVKALLDDTEAMRCAVSGEHTEGTFHAANWADKPHRVLYDCIGHVHVLASALLEARAENARLRSDAQAAVALVVEHAADAVEDTFPGTLYLSNASKAVDRIRALTPADGLAMVEALRKERDDFATSEKELSGAYLRVRAKLNAWDTKFGGDDRFDVTEAALDRLAADLSDAQAQIEALRDVARAFEAWEADVILAADWTHATPRLTQDQWDELVRIQGLRNAAMPAKEGE